MKRILLVNYGYYPAQKYGGPVNSVHNFCELMSQKYECYILTCDHEMNSKERLKGIEEGWNNTQHSKIMYVPDEKITYTYIKSIISEVKPDVVYLQSIFEAIFVIPFIRALLNRLSTFSLIIAPRGDLCKGAMRKKYKKIPYLLFIRSLTNNAKKLYFHSTAKDETLAIEKYFGRKKVIFEIENIPSIIDNHDEPYSIDKILKIVFISRIAPKKNLIQAIRIINKCENVIFDIYGPIEDQVYWDECQREMKKGNANQFNYCGMLEHEKVYDAFRKHDLFLFPTLSENYGHVIVEAMQCGCPVLISDQTPWNEVNTFDVGGAFSLENEQAFVDYIKRLQKLNSVEMNRLRKNTISFINNHLKFDELESKYAEMIESVTKF